MRESVGTKTSAAGSSESRSSKRTWGRRPVPPGWYQSEPQAQVPTLALLCDRGAGVQVPLSLAVDMFFSRAAGVPR